MSTFHGAEVDRLRELGGTLRAGSATIEAIRGRLDGAVPALGWAGPDRERFAQDWLSRFAPALGTVVTALEAAASGADGHAGEQETASTAGAGTAGAATAGGAGEGVAATTPTATAPGAAGGSPTGGQPGGAAAGGVGVDRYGNPTGELSAQYESPRQGVGTVSTGRGDAGGVSYGTYQLSSTRGTAGEFVTWARTHYPAAHERLDGLTPGSAAFGEAWRGLATADDAGFGQAQHAFIQTQHHEQGVDRIMRRVEGFTLQGRSDVVADVVWSTSVQHGPGGAGTVFANALRGQDVATMSDADLIRAVYAERGRDDGMAYFRSSDPDFRQGVVDRFPREQADALERLGR